MNEVVLIIDVDSVGAAKIVTVLKIVDNEEPLVFIAITKPLYVLPGIKEVIVVDWLAVFEE